MNNKQFMHQALTEVLGTEIGSLDVVKKYFSEDYVQVVNGKKIDFNEFVTHLEVLKDATKSISITIKSIAEGDGCVHTQHIAQAVKKNGSKSEFEVFANFQLENGKILRCEELTRMISGDVSDDDLGSRT